MKRKKMIKFLYEDSFVSISSEVDMNTIFDTVGNIVE